MSPSYRLIIDCPDRVGIVAEVSAFIAQHHGWLLEASYHSDQETGRFYMRNEIKVDSLDLTLSEFRQQFAALAQRFDMQWRLTESQQAKKMLILASHASHCLADLLHRWHSGDLACDIPAVVSNHENLREMVEWHDIPFHYVPFPKADKAAAFAEVASYIDHYQADFTVLARFMQIMPNTLCEAYAGQMINIHHSFLPSFIGANPYQKAYERGVKLIGATCHYVTGQLDEGPIIEQDVVRVSHRHSKQDMVRLGKDVESDVLARGVRLHIEDRVIISGNKTVILD
ncbi:MAG: formyltetrahydrofolate deformylase [Pseudomonadales bacterium]|nr:formyltetrahydrofolate deformylase [Pseudomonadales bacterium]